MTNQTSNLPDLPPPPVLRWYRIYGTCFGLLLGALGLLMLLVIYLQLNDAGNRPPVAELLTNLTSAGSCFGIGVVYLVAPGFVPRSLASYLFHGALIAMSLFGCCTIPLAGALLYFWIQSDTRFYFGVGS